MAKFDKFLSKLVDTAWKGVLAALDLRVTAVEAGEGIVNTMILVEDTMPVAVAGLLNHGVLLTTAGGGYLANHIYVCRSDGEDGYGWVDVTALILADKVDKVTGKALSTNDFTDIYKAKVDAALPLADGVTVVEDLPVAGADYLGKRYLLLSSRLSHRTDYFNVNITDPIYATQAAAYNGDYVYDSGLGYYVNSVKGTSIRTFDAGGGAVSAYLFSSGGVQDIELYALSTDSFPPSSDLFEQGSWINWSYQGSIIAGTLWECVLTGPAYGWQQVTITEKKDLETLTGTTVYVHPGRQYKWSASGTCTLTASGWAVSGHQVAYVLITLAAEATLSVSGATVADDDALSAAGTYACYLVNENGTVRFKVANFTEAA